MLLLALPAYAQEAPPPPAPADTLAPRTGIDPTAPDLREHLDAAFGVEPAPAPPGPAFTITPSLGIGETFSDGAALSAGASGSDFITTIGPALAVNGATRRLTVNLNYDPTVYLYARNGNQSQIAQAFDGDVVATLAPNLAFLDLRGNAQQQSVYGGLGPPGTVTLDRQNRQTQSSVAATPYLARSLGAGGTLQLGYSYVYSALDAPGTAPVALGDATGGVLPGNYGSSWLGTNRVFGSYATGEALGRAHNVLALDASLYSGSGVLGTGRRVLFTDTGSYAITRLITLIGEAGYEDLSYGNVYRYTGPVGSAGVRLTPGRRSAVTIEYRNLDGFASLFVQGSVQLTPRIRAFGGYSEGISTYQQDQQDTLLAGSPDPTGNPDDASLAAPLLAGSDFFGATTDLYRIRRLDVSLAWVFARDVFGLSLEQDHESLIATASPATSAGSNQGIVVGFTWQHELSPDVRVSAFLQYGTRMPTSLDTGGSENSVSASVRLEKLFSQTLSGYIRYDGTYLTSAFVGRNGNQDDFVVGVRKTF